MTDTTTPHAVWIDGHPQLEAIAAAVYEQCETGDSGIVHDDPRNIAVAALAAVAPTPPAALSVGRLARAIYDAALATNVIPHPAWDQLDAAGIERFRMMAGLVIERLGGDRAACPDPIECGHEAALGQAQQEIRRLGLMVDEYGDGASALTRKLKRVRDLHRETCLVARGELQPPTFQCGMCQLLDAPAAPVLPAPADRAAVLREAADAIDQHEWDQGCDGVGCCADTPGKAADLLRRMADETQHPEAHQCGNCEGIDPDTCLTNPDRPKQPPMDPVHILGIDSDEDSSALRAALLARQQPDGSQP